MLIVLLPLLSTTVLLPLLSPKPPAATKLRDALIAGESDMATLGQLCKACADSRAPFRAELLGDGALWRAVSIVRGEGARQLPNLSRPAREELIESRP